jgi:hypothetical protein
MAALVHSSAEAKASDEFDDCDIKVILRSLKHPWGSSVRFEHSALGRCVHVWCSSFTSEPVLESEKPVHK